MSRTRLIAALAAVIAALFLAQYARAWLAIPAEQARTSDFAGTYAAATLWREGHADLMYSEAAEQHVLSSTGTPAGHLDIPYENPPAAAPLASPLTLLDPSSAYRVFSLLQVALLLLGVVIAARAAPWRRGMDGAVKVAVGAIAIAGLGTGLLLVEGQWDGLPALGVGLAYAAWRSEHGGRAGFAVGFTTALVKPHLGVGLFAFALGRRDWRAAAGMVAGALSAAALSLALTGTGGTAAFVHALLQPSNNPLMVMQGASGLIASWLGSSTAALPLTLAAGLAGAGVSAWLGAASRRRDLFEPAFAGATVLSLFVSLHLLGHDLTLLAPAFVALLAWNTTRIAATRTGWPDVATGAAVCGWVLLSFASQQDLGNASAAPPGRLTPLVLLALAGGCAVLVARTRFSDARSAPRVASSAQSWSPSAPR